MKSVNFLAASLLAGGTSVLGGCMTTSQDGYEVLRVFSDGVGVVRARGEADGNRLTLTSITPGAAEYEGASIDDGQPVNLDENSIVITGTDANGAYYTGNGFVGATPFAIGGYQTTNNQALIIYGETSQGDTLLMAGGMEATAIPNSGSALYSGATAIGARDGTFAETGTFTMNVNFATNKASIGANTANAALVGTGINVNGDKLSGDGLTLTVLGTEHPAVLDGFLNGPNATAVSGVFHDDSRNPIFGGAFAGQ
ncbi:MAG: hypothetical protein VX874_10590 [Pseudomonadota bacterium]|nr:hypothetical protein [Pseudomonadota bacterium]